VALVWRGDETARRAGIASNERLRPVVEALAALGADPIPVVYRDDIAREVRAELLEVDGVLVWIDPSATVRTEPAWTRSCVMSQRLAGG
jgi:hypothetical protein